MTDCFEILWAFLLGGNEWVSNEQAAAVSQISERVFDGRDIDSEHSVGHESVARDWVLYQPAAGITPVSARTCNALHLRNPGNCVLTTLNRLHMLHLSALGAAWLQACLATSIIETRATKDRLRWAAPVCPAQLCSRAVLSSQVFWMHTHF
jgi:hypothetical protein